MTTVRKSSRVRKKANSYYDDAAKAALLEEQKKNDKKRKAEDDNLTVNHSDEDEEDDEVQLDTESGSDDDGDFHPGGVRSKKTNTKTPRKMSATNKGKTQARKSPKKTATKAGNKVETNYKKSPNASPAIVKRRNNKKSSPLNVATVGGKKSTNGANVTVKTAFTKTKVSQALTMLSKRVLPTMKANRTNNVADDAEINPVENQGQETPETSLIAALLASAKPIRGIPSTDRPKIYYHAHYQGEIGVGSGNDPLLSSSTSERIKRTSSIINVCLPQLDGILRHLIRTTEHEGPHELHVKLLNLLFRSVGGSVETNIASGTDLDELEDDDWDDLISKVVTIMKNESDADQTPLCADDDDLDVDIYEDTIDSGKDITSFIGVEAGSGTNTVTLTTRQIGKIAYRTIYKEFWYRLGHLLLAYTPSPAAAMVSDEESDEVSNKGDDIDSSEGDDSEASDDDSTVNDEGSSFSSLIKKRKMKSSHAEKSKINTKRKKSNDGTASKEASQQRQQQQRESKGFSSNRFQLEKVRDLILRMTELVSVGQPDLRAAGTLAVLQLAKACVERTVELEQKIRVAKRQHKVAALNQSKRKQQSLQHHLENWKRHQAELQEIVETPVFQGVFIHRYRDANDHIRRDCLQALSDISLIRPDIFLVDTYLKYFGWMASDKTAPVRIAALEGLAAPFRVAAAGPVDSLSSSTTLTSNHSLASPGTPFQIDIANMQNVTNKFLGRIVDCLDDSNSLRVQEVAMKLLLGMVREEFLDDWDDDLGWEKINMKSFDPFTSLNVRKDALYFVMDQIEAFDADANGAASIGEKKRLDQLLSIAKWSAIRLTDSNIHVDDMNIELVDHLVRSIVSMPEHRDLVLNWPMMLKAIRSENPQQGSVDEKEEIATQRILLRILATSAEIEFGKNKQNEANEAKIHTENSRKRKKTTSKHVSDTSLDDLSIALLKNLPNLLDAFKSDTISLRDVTKLPLTISSPVFSLPSHKGHFQKLVKTLCQLYVDSTDEQVLQNIAQTLSKWVEGEHTRISETKVTIKRLSGALQDRLMELFQQSDPDNEEEQEERTRKRNRYKKANSSTVGQSSLFSTTKEADTEHSVSLLMLRWKTLLMECKAKYLFEKAEEDDVEDEVEGLFFTVSEAMGKRLIDRMPKHDRDTNPTIWKTKDPDTHDAVYQTIEHALSVLLVIISQQLLEILDNQKDFGSSTQAGNENIDKDNEHDFPLLKMKVNFVRLLGLCFDQHLTQVGEVEYSSEQIDFAAGVQDAAAKATSDLRSLFPSDWSNARDPVRKKLAFFTGDPDFETLISGFVRWFQKGEEREGKNEKDSFAVVGDSLLPLARIINVNFFDFHRKEAGMLLKHIGSRKTYASETILALTRQQKKNNPLRMLEAYMSCLKFSFENWVDNEPNEPEESAPSEEAIQKFEEAEQHHQQLFSSMEIVAQKLSSTLGFAGKLSNDVLKKSICGFIKEGIRFAFDGPSLTEDDELVVGSRLAFLLMLQKFTNWVKKEKDDIDKLTNFVISKETELRRHPEFDDVHPDDLNALSEFKKSLGIKAEISDSVVSESGYTKDYSFSMDESPMSSKVSSRRRMSTAGSRVSCLSGLSELSPLPEENDESARSSGGSLVDSDGNSRVKSLGSTLGDKLVDSDDTNESSDGLTARSNSVGDSTNFTGTVGDASKLTEATCISKNEYNESEIGSNDMSTNHADTVGDSSNFTEATRSSKECGESESGSNDMSTNHAGTVGDSSKFTEATHKSKYGCDESDSGSNDVSTNYTGSVGDSTKLTEATHKSKYGCDESDSGSNDMSTNCTGSIGDSTKLTEATRNSKYGCDESDSGSNDMSTNYTGNTGTVGDSTKFTSSDAITQVEKESSVSDTSRDDCSRTTAFTDHTGNSVETGRRISIRSDAAEDHDSDESEE